MELEIEQKVTGREEEEWFATRQLSWLALCSSGAFEGLAAAAALGGAFESGCR